VALSPGNRFIALGVQGIEHWFPNPKLDVGETEKYWKLELFTGPNNVTAQPYCKTLEQIGGEMVLHGGHCTTTKEQTGPVAATV
jgi:hypothetical protein